MERVACHYADCGMCSRSLVIKTNARGEMLYSCKKNIKLHRAVEAKKCSKFACRIKGSSVLCASCKGGK